MVFISLDIEVKKICFVILYVLIFFCLECDIIFSLEILVVKKIVFNNIFMKIFFDKLFVRMIVKMVIIIMIEFVRGVFCKFLIDD